MLYYVVVFNNIILLIIYTKYETIYIWVNYVNGCYKYLEFCFSSLQNKIVVFSSCDIFFSVLETKNVNINFLQGQKMLIKNADGKIYRD